jgi:hypothetical protein
MTATGAQEYRVQFEDRPTTTAPDLMGVFRDAEVRASGAIRQPPSREDVEKLMAWLESDSLDWDAVARVRSDGW